MDVIRRVALCAFLVLALAVGGCGGGSDEDGTSEEKDVFYPWVKGPSREFLVRGGDNLIQYFGHEGTPAEKAAVNAVIQKWMRARASEDWAEDCRYLSKNYRKTLVANARAATEGKVTSCPEALAYLGEDASGDLRNTLTGPIDSLRVKKGRGYAQWHGPERDWILPVIEEDGRWTVASAAPIDRNK